MEEQIQKINFDKLKKKFETQQRLTILKSSKQQERDSSYKKMLSSLFSKLPSRSSPLRSARPARPEVHVLSKKRTCWSNFTDYSLWLNRPASHISRYMSVEMQTSSTLSGSGLTLASSLSVSDLSQNIRNYISLYVSCRSCSSLVTSMSKNTKNRLFELTCSACGGQRSVGTIKPRM